MSSFSAADDEWFPFDFYDLVWGYETSLDMFEAQRNFPLSSEGHKEAHSIIKDVSLGPQLSAYTLYVMGSRLPGIIPSYIGMYWTTLPSLPQPKNVTLFFTSNNRLAATATNASRKYRGFCYRSDR